MKAIHIPQSHDALFKQLLHDNQIALEFMQLHLPDDVKAGCDLETLKLESGSFVEPDLKQRFNDILYSVKAKQGTSYIYCLVEHQHKPDNLIAFRLMHYAIMTMASHLKQGHKKLPLVIPILFYTGPKRHPRNISLDWYQLFDCPNMAKKVYNRPFELIDVSQIDDSELLKRQVIGLLEYIFKHIETRDMFDMLKDLRSFLSHNQLSNEQIKTLLIYLLDRGKIEQSQAFLDVLFKETPHDGDQIMGTLSEYLKSQQGREHLLQLFEQRGVQLGLHSAKVEIASNLLNKGISTEVIKEATGLSYNEIEQLIK